jgi:hypothetical protein
MAAFISLFSKMVAVTIVRVKRFLALSRQRVLSGAPRVRKRRAPSEPSMGKLRDDRPLIVGFILGVVDYSATRVIVAFGAWSS